MFVSTPPFSLFPIDIDRNVEITCSADNAPRVTMGLFNLSGYPWFKGMGPSAFMISCSSFEEEE